MEIQCGSNPQNPKLNSHQVMNGKKTKQNKTKKKKRVRGNKHQSDKSH